MNIFYLDTAPDKAAKMHCDKHCIKMILETAQLLCTAHRELDGDYWADEVGLYKSAFKNHPSAIWVRETMPQYRWAFTLFYNLCKEYERRYKKTHKAFSLSEFLCIDPINIFQQGWQEPPQCMPDQYKGEDTVKAYRDYYLGEKMGFAKWNYTKEPSWIELK